MAQQPIKLDQTDASQGRKGVGVRYVLIGGLALVIVIFVVLFFVMK